MQKYYIIITFKPVNLNPILPSEFAQNCFCTFGPPAESRSLRKSEGPTDWSNDEFSSWPKPEILKNFDQKKIINLLWISNE